MVAFLLGNEFKLDRLRDTGPLILGISLFVIVGGGVVVGAGLLVLGFPLVVASTIIFELVGPVLVRRGLR